MQLRDLRAPSFLLLLLLLAWGLLPVIAGPMGFKNLLTITDQADAVVVATVTQQTQSGAVVTLVLAVDRVLKGTLTPNQLVSAQWNSRQGSTPNTNVKGTHALWFLQGSSTGT